MEKINPKLSIIIPVFNVEPFLKKCLDSVINQTYSNLEIILIDDESPDNCGEICDDYAKNDERIKVIHQKNKGLSGARNSGLKIVSGDYIAFLDSDDWIHPKMYETMMNIILSNKLEIAECGIIEKKDDKEELSIKKPTYEVIIEDCYQALSRIIKNSQFSVWRRIYNRSLLNDYEFLLNKTSEDIYFTVDILKKTKRIGYIEYPFYNYRENPTSITKSSYSLRRLNDSISASFYLKEKMKDYEVSKNKNLSKIITNHILWKLLLHYKRINYNSHLDTDYYYRKKIKSYIKQNYYKNNNHEFYLKLSNFLTVRQFALVIKMNKIKHKILRTNTFN